MFCTLHKLLLARACLPVLEAAAAARSQLSSQTASYSSQQLNSPTHTSSTQHQQQQPLQQQPLLLQQQPAGQIRPLAGCNCFQLNQNRVQQRNYSQQSFQPHNTGHEASQLEQGRFSQLRRQLSWIWEFIVPPGLEGPRGWLRVFSAKKPPALRYLTIALASPQSLSWAQLYPPPLFSAQGLRRQLVRTYMHTRMHYLPGFLWLRGDALLAAAHTDYQTDRFKLEVKQALEYAAGLYAAANWVKLRPLVSEALLKSMHAAWEGQKASMVADAAQEFTARLDIDLQSIEVLTARRCRALALVQYDPKLFGDGAGGGMAWDVVVVSAEGVLHTEYSASHQGQQRQMQQVKVQQSGSYVFCRGPVRVDEVLRGQAMKAASWILLGWMH